MADRATKSADVRAKILELLSTKAHERPLLLGRLAEAGFSNRTGLITQTLAALKDEGLAHEMGGVWFYGEAPKIANDNANAADGYDSASSRRVITSPDLIEFGFAQCIAAKEFTADDLKGLPPEVVSSVLLSRARQLLIIRMPRNDVHAIAVPKPSPGVGLEYRLYSPRSLLDGVVNDMGLGHEDLYNSKGKLRPIVEINRRFSSIAPKGYLLDGITAVSYLASDGFFHLLAWEEQPIVPAFHTQSALYLMSWGSRSFRVLCDWIACTRRELLSRPCLFLVIRGVTRDGKSLILDGLGGLYRPFGPVPGAQITGQFNKFLAESPIVHFAEEFPTDYRGQTLGDGFIKELVSAGVHTVADKHVSAVPLLGCTRNGMSTNNRRIYEPPKVMEPDACEALAARFIVAETPALTASAERVAMATARVKAGARATERDSRPPTRQEIADAVTLGPQRYLQALGGRPHTDPHWIAGDGLFTAHLKHIQQTHVVPEDRRGDSFFLQANAEIASDLKGQFLRRRANTGGKK